MECERCIVWRTSSRLHSINAAILADALKCTNNASTAAIWPARLMRMACHGCIIVVPGAHAPVSGTMQAVGGFPPTAQIGHFLMHFAAGPKTAAQSALVWHGAH